MSTCELCACIDGYDEPEVYRAETRQARAVHECCECGEPIPIGERYEYATGLNDGRWWIYKTCAPCAEIRGVLMCQGWLFTTVWEDIAEQVFPEAEHVGLYECLAKLETKRARDKLERKFQEWDARTNPPEPLDPSIKTGV